MSEKEKYHRKVDRHTSRAVLPPELQDSEIVAFEMEVVDGEEVWTVKKAV